MLEDALVVVIVRFVPWEGSVKSEEGHIGNEPSGSRG